MIRRTALAILPLLVLPALAADWPPGMREVFREGCLDSASEALGREPASRYCDCTVARIERDFSAEDFAGLQQAELPAPLLERLQWVSGQCLGELQGQG